MKHQLFKFLRLFSIVLALTFIVSSTTLVLTGCGGSDAKAEEAKKKKKKKKARLAEEDLEEVGDAGDSDSNNGANSNPESNSSSTNTNSSSKDVPTENAEAERIWKELIKGNERFVAGKHTDADFAIVRKTLVSGQKPEVIVLGCADSRVPPELIFDKNLGSLFVVRAAGNIADSVLLGSIEYAVEHLKSKVLLILGHESCGAVAAAVANEEMPSKNLSAIVNKIVPAFEGSDSCPLGGKMESACVELNVQKSAKDVVSNSSIIKKAISENRLTLIKAVYQLESGKVVRLK